MTLVGVDGLGLRGASTRYQDHSTRLRHDRRGGRSKGVLTMDERSAPTFSVAQARVCTVAGDARAGNWPGRCHSRA